MKSGPCVRFLFYNEIIMKILLEKFNPKLKLNSDTLIIFDSKSKKISKDISDLDEDLSGLIKEHLQVEGYDFAPNSSSIINISKQIKIAAKYKSLKRVILIGLGDNLRKAYALAFRTAKTAKAERIIIYKAQDPSLFAQTAILLDYEFLKYKSNKEDKKSKKILELKILVDEIKASDKKLLKQSLVISKATCLARDLVWEPASVVTPSYLADKAKEIKSEYIKLNIKEASECKKLGMGAFLAVASGSDEAPKFIEFNYKPNGKIKKHIALIGKGVTFDSGGLSLKPPKAMEMMKEDMSGAAAILGIMQALSELDLNNIQVTAIIAATENMPSGKAYRPGDVIMAMNGKSIEVNNTDAEGRLTLADAVAYVSNKYPDEIIDFATLTGACTVALGNICSGLMGNNEDLIKNLEQASQVTGELVWNLPLYDEYKKALKSTIADLINANSQGKAGAQNGALFIQEFVGKQKDSDKYIPWAHLDIAGPCWFDQDMDYSPKGASGVPVRTIMQYLIQENDK